MALTINEQIAPEIARATIAQATARGLTVNGYLRQVLGLRGYPKPPFDKLPAYRGEAEAVSIEDRRQAGSLVITPIFCLKDVSSSSRSDG